MDGSAGQFELYFNIGTTVPDYQKVCPLKLDFDKGEEMDSWYNLCTKIKNNVITAMDPTWSSAVKFNKTDAVAQFLMSKEFATGADATVPARIVNNYKDKQIDFTATLSKIKYTPKTEEVLEIDFDIKVYDGSTFVETNKEASM